MVYSMKSPLALYRVSKRPTSLTTLPGAPLEAIGILTTPCGGRRDTNYERVARLIPLRCCRSRPQGEGQQWVVSCQLIIGNE